MEVLNLVQGSPEWHAARLGIPTASMFATVMAKGRSGGDSKTRATYLHKLAGELITGKQMDNFVNAHMERGHLMEDEARQHYAFVKDVEPQPVGFIRNGRKGCSPDSLVSSDGMLEIKTKLAHMVVDLILRDEFPSDHRAQCQGQLWVAEREWVDLTIYWPGMPPMIKRAYRDEIYIAEMAAAVRAFNEELYEVVERVRAYGLPGAQAAA
jgi:hypothetical protein